ncbi:codanin-1-like [Penaeus japonicus]|uniref:codanin-1-like n=1 Tax=Penaeus japonicus TaxID=27405 RepID=UPI001C70DD95|nr:codanin-1-like [Penaeus japonicus]
MQLEDNFFHNNPSSVRKTTEFVIERVSSNVIKKIRTKIIPEQRESALEKLKSTIDEKIKSSPQTVEKTRDTLQKQVMDLSQELAHHIRAQSSQVTHQECQGQVLSSLTFLMPPDMTPQTSATHVESSPPSSGFVFTVGRVSWPEIVSPEMVRVICLEATPPHASRRWIAEDNALRKQYSLHTNKEDLNLWNAVTQMDIQEQSEQKKKLCTENGKNYVQILEGNWKTS